MFDNILLEPEQTDLLVLLVEASRSVPREQRQKFIAAGPMACAPPNHRLIHPGLPDGEIRLYIGDLEILDREGLIAMSYDSRGTALFDVTPLGYRFYEHLKQEGGEPLQRIQSDIRDYVNASSFVAKYDRAHKKWADAEAMLWSTDSPYQLSTVGHLCREAMQEFATALVNKFRPSVVNSNKASTVDRIKAVLKEKKNFGSREKQFLDALVAYWGAVSDLVQRQEHGAQKEGGNLVWEDGRRVVFQTAMIMLEIDHALS